MTDVLFYIVIGVLAWTAFMALGGASGRIQVRPGLLRPLFGLLALELIAVGVWFYAAPQGAAASAGGLLVPPNHERRTWSVGAYAIDYTAPRFGWVTAAADNAPAEEDLPPAAATTARVELKSSGETTTTLRLSVTRRAADYRGEWDAYVEAAAQRFRAAHSPHGPVTAEPTYVAGLPALRLSGREPGPKVPRQVTRVLLPLGPDDLLEVRYRYNTVGHVPDLDATFGTLVSSLTVTGRPPE